MKKIIFLTLMLVSVMATASACVHCTEYRPGVASAPNRIYRGPEPPPYRHCNDGYYEDRYYPHHRGGWGYGHHRRPRARIGIDIVI